MVGYWLIDWSYWCDVSGTVFHPGTRSGVLSLMNARYYVLRLPYVYVGPNGPFHQPKHHVSSMFFLLFFSHLVCFLPAIPLKLLSNFLKVADNSVNVSKQLGSGQYAELLGILFRSELFANEIQSPFSRVGTEIINTANSAVCLIYKITKCIVSLDKYMHIVIV